MSVVQVQELSRSVLILERRNRIFLHIMFKKTFYLSAIFTAIGNVANAAPAAVASSNPLRGGSALIGYSSSNTISNENTETISYQLAPSQTDDADIGAILDFSTIDNPQPIRGSLGGTDPGPRPYLSFLEIFCIFS
jgi:hypothetical protein